MLNIRNAFFSLLIVLSLHVQAKSIEITITQEQQDYFHQVACASDSAALIKIYNTDSEKFSNEISELTSFSSEHRIKAIVAGLKVGKTESQVEQFIELQTGNSFKSNTKYIAEKGFEKFHKSAISGLFALCRTDK
jgi:hypothetical protein